VRVPAGSASGVFGAVSEMFYLLVKRVSQLLRDFGTHQGFDSKALGILSLINGKCPFFAVSVNTKAGIAERYK
jgi:hypothetical protein